jgi:hypothetical protein
MIARRGPRERGRRLRDRANATAQRNTSVVMPVPVAFRAHPSRARSQAVGVRPTTWEKARPNVLLRP